MGIGPAAPPRRGFWNGSPDLLDERRRVAEERHPDVVRTGRGRHAHRHARRARVRVRSAGVRIRRRERDHLHLLAADGDLQPVRDAHIARPPQLDLNVVLRLLRKQVRYQRAAAGAERQPIHAVVLLQVGCQAVGLAHHRRRRTPDRHPADRPRRSEIALQQRLRHPQRGPDVVEAVAGIVGGQQGVDVDLQGQQVPDGVAVLGAVETVERRGSAGIGSRRGRPIQLALQPGREPERRCLIRPRDDLPAASSRRAVCGRPSPRRRDAHRQWSARACRRPVRRRGAG